MMNFLVFYFSSNEMVVTQNFRLMWIRFSEKIIVDIRKCKDRKNILECPSKSLPNPSALRMNRLLRNLDVLKPYYSVVCHIFLQRS